MTILGIETSCDETSIALLTANGTSRAPTFCVQKTVIHSQIDVHREYGGVYPTLAKREHERNLVPVLIEVLTDARLLQEKKKDEQTIKEFADIFTHEQELLTQFTETILQIKKPAINAIAVTVGPGLQPALWAGINFARALSRAWELPLISVNHMEGHLISSLLSAEGEEGKKEILFPAIGLLVSGGHTELVQIEAWGNYSVLGRTRDDAAGESFDKVARILGLPYPGGPALSQLAETSIGKTVISLPRPMIHSNDYDFSFSGLKTAVLYATRERSESLTNGQSRAALAHEFEEAVIEVLISKTRRALTKTQAKTLIVGGGVIANKKLRAALELLATEIGVQLSLPRSEYTGDNAAMIAAAGYLHREEAGHSFEASGTLSL